ncbi:MAG: hypothetical protein LBR53_11675 [Deltaproteobacteria bacterium]|jgi:hypothetical protein|nr:hypothetical protein [Deltaproteobacteria bacterium]
MTRKRRSPADTAFPPIAIIDFGEAWILRELLVKTGYIEAIKDAYPENPDDVLALLSYRLTSDAQLLKSASVAHQNSYARMLYPNASLSSRNIGVILRKLGSFETWKRFFSAHLKFLAKNVDRHVVLTESRRTPEYI